MIEAEVDLGYHGPDSVAWRLHDHPAMAIGGVRALLIQTTHPAIVAGVADHSGYRVDPWKRLERTVEYIVNTTYGTRTEADKAVAQVRRVHSKVRGVDPTNGCSYAASDPELLLWVGAVEAESFLLAYRRYGGKVSAADADRYVVEMAGATMRLGLPGGMFPQSLAELQSYLCSVAGLCVTEATRDVAAVALRPPLPLRLRPAGALVGAAAVELLPQRIRHLYGFRSMGMSRLALHVSMRGVCKAARVMLPRNPVAQEARRVAGGKLIAICTNSGIISTWPPTD